jgi:hypothetical protein
MDIRTQTSEAGSGVREVQKSSEVELRCVELQNVNLRSIEEYNGVSLRKEVFLIVSITVKLL